MIYIFVPYYHEDIPEFKESLAKQTVPYRLIKRNTKASKILWTEAVNDFWREIKRLNTKDSDIVGVMCNDISFGDLFREATSIKFGEVYVPINCGVKIIWKFKLIINDPHIDSFLGRCFFMTVKEFKESGGLCKWLPHTLSDIDFGLKMIKKGIKPKLMNEAIYHRWHDCPKVSNVSKLSYKNPIAWTIFLLRHPNRYTLLNILKAWYDAI